MRTVFNILFFLISLCACFAQEIHITEFADLNLIYGRKMFSDNLVPMNELGIDFGYVLYESDISIESEEQVLYVENIRDFATVYLDEILQGTITDDQKQVNLRSKPGKYKLRLFVENIGRITYGPEILDNLKGIFGKILLEGKTINDWTMTELNVRSCDVEQLKFSDFNEKTIPGFFRSYFSIGNPKDKYLDTSGLGMGEVWINGEYTGSFWEKEKLQSILIPASILKKGKNEIVIFEMKNNKKNSLRLTDEPVFK
ncbi:MAG: hypothetical protein ACK5KP_00825 [Paludibacteraceae bacterium]